MDFKKYKDTVYQIIGAAMEVHSELNGRKLDKMPTKKGVYILNGRKVVVK